MFISCEFCLNMIVQGANVCCAKDVDSNGFIVDRHHDCGNRCRMFEFDGACSLDVFTEDEKASILERYF